MIDNIHEAIFKHCKNDIPLLEIGPGQGVLTQLLNKRYPQFKAVEFDTDMIELLKLSINEDRLVQADILKTNLGQLFEQESINVVGNFPYNISSQIIFKILDNVSKIPVVIGMFQKEVAERIAAAKKGRQKGIITIRAQLHYKVTKLFDIGPDAFDPPPKVQSSVILMERKEDYLPDVDISKLSKVLKAAYGQRRKKMRNTLKAYFDNLDDPIFQKRPEELDVEEFVNIAKLIK